MTRSFFDIAKAILDPRKTCADLDRELARMKTDDLERQLSERKVIVFLRGWERRS
jgi:hypothetical protein